MLASGKFICCADHYFTENPFVIPNPENKSYHVCTYVSGKFSEFAVEVSDADVIMDTEISGQD